ncbi:MAG: hypothetical protein JWN48_4129 [Myxococcaceae bacterium]|nr:hypothetical protein [Myxococcaceae bacterium]
MTQHRSVHASGYWPGPARFVTTRWMTFFRYGPPERLRDEALRTDSSTVAAVYRHYGSAVGGYIHKQRARFGIPRHLSTEDLTQEFFEVQLRRDALSSVRASKGSFRAWLRACVKNFLRDVGARERAGKRVSERKLEPLYRPDGHELALPSGRPLPDGELDHCEVKRQADALEPGWTALFDPPDGAVGVPACKLEQDRLRQQRKRARTSLLERMRAALGVEVKRP